MLASGHCDDRLALMRYKGKAAEDPEPVPGCFERNLRRPQIVLRRGEFVLRQLPFLERDRPRLNAQGRLALRH